MPPRRARSRPDASERRRATPTLPRPQPCRLHVCVLCPRAFAGLDRVAPRFHPTHRTVKMEREQFRSLTRIGRMTPLDRVAGPPVKLAPAPVRETLVGCLANERVTKAK